jgi:uncharacterized protein YlxW (UPF0749 family)
MPLCAFCDFVQTLAEERSKAENLKAEKDAAESRARLAETKALSLTREVEDLQIKLDETERSRKGLQDEINSVLESKDDVGKSVCLLVIFLIFQPYQYVIIYVYLTCRLLI